jgi:hypothetical protein
MKLGWIWPFYTELQEIKLLLNQSDYYWNKSRILIEKYYEIKNAYPLMSSMMQLNP